MVLVQAPKALDALREIAEVVAASAAPDVTVLVGGRVKHMTHAMNDVLRASFTDVSATLARQKSRVLVARGPKPGPSSFPRRQEHRRPRADRLRARRGVRRHEDRHRHPRAARLRWTAWRRRPAPRSTSAAAPGVLAAALARSRPELTVLAVDQSAAAVASAAATAAANGLGDRIRVIRDDAADVRSPTAASTSSSATRRSTSARRS